MWAWTGLKGGLGDRFWLGDVCEVVGEVGVSVGVFLCSG